MIASTSFISDTLGPRYSKHDLQSFQIKLTLLQRYIEPIPLNLDAIAVESTCRTPVVFLLSAGSDPSSLIEGLGKKNKKELRSISSQQTITSSFKSYFMFLTYG